MVAYLLIAAAFWGWAVPPCGAPYYTATSINAPNVVATANWSTCEIRIDRRRWHRLTRPEKCTVIVHEYGHLIGKKHTRTGVMKPVLTGTVRTCRVHFGK